jgi:hypothetical protein
MHAKIGRLSLTGKAYQTILTLHYGRAAEQRIAFIQLGWATIAEQSGEQVRWHPGVDRLASGGDKSAARRAGVLNPAGGTAGKGD